MNNDNPLLGKSVSCSVCGKDEELHWNRETNERLHFLKLCFTCDHWRGHLEADKARDNVVIVDGQHYLYYPDVKGDQWFAGHGGARFIIKFHNGRVVETRNLWHQGGITDHWKDKFPDNAEFVQRKELSTYS